MQPRKSAFRLNCKHEVFEEAFGTLAQIDHFRDATKMIIWQSLE